MILFICKPQQIPRFNVSFVAKPSGDLKDVTICLLMLYRNRKIT